jgi:hypothetical protein
MGERKLDPRIKDFVEENLFALIDIVVRDRGARRLRSLIIRSIL